MTNFGTSLALYKGIKEKNKTDRNLKTVSRSSKEKFKF